MTPLIAGNWKMNGTRASLDEVRRLKAALPSPAAEVLICPPAVLIPALVAEMGDWGAVGGQDCHASVSGAHTGDIAAAQLADAGARYVIVGHSERRADHGEGDGEVRAKAEAAIAAGLGAIVCIGESLEQRDSGAALEVIVGQLAGSVPDAPEGLVVAYEPVWAIGTGRTASPEQIAEVHGALRAALTGRFGAAGAEIRLLYGGSVKPGNAAEILGTQDVNGALVGGASLKAEDFGAIIAAGGETSRR